MADFNTHIFTATAVGAVYATVATKGLSIPTAPALLLAAATAVGGILPDIDLKASTPSRALFLVLGAVIAILGMLQHVTQFSVLELLALGAVLFVVVRFLLRALFHKFTVHRGSLHSLAASLMFGVATAVLCHRYWQQAADISWLVGAGVTLGCLTHLILDEVYSVDFTGTRVKRSFGSALKVVDTARWPGSLAVIAVTIVGLWMAPPVSVFIKRLQAVDPNWQSWFLALDF